MPEVKPNWLKADSKGRPVGVDKENNVLRGYVVAQEGPFKTPGRGEFDLQALRTIKTMINAQALGLKSRFTHPSLSEDGLGKFLGRAKNGRLDKVNVERDGQLVSLHAVRADLHFDPTSLQTPPQGGKPYGFYVMNLAESDPDALSSSLVLQVEEEFRLEKDGTPKKDEAGNPLPPLWRPTKLHATDIVDEGDAVDGVLSANLAQVLAGGPELEKALRFDGPARLGCQLLDKIFPGLSRATIREKCLAWLERYLALRFQETPKGRPDVPDLTPWEERLEDNRHFLARLARRRHDLGSK